MIDNIACPYCLRVFGALKRASFHVKKCNSGTKDNDAIALLYTSLYKYNKEDLISDYVTLEKSISVINQERRIPCRILKFLAIHYNILRTNAQSRLLSINKTRATLIARYGSSNPLKAPSAIQKMKIQKEVIRDKRSRSMKKIWSDKNYYADAIEKMKSGVIKKYGVSTVFSLKEFQDRAKEVIQHKFGVDNISKSQYKKDLLVGLGKYAPDCSKSRYMLYKEAVRKETYKYASEIYNLWVLMEGQCYYTLNTLIDELGRPLPGFENRPSIDHKVSILFGFLNNIPPEVIGNSKNLCVCSSKINSKKRSLTENKFRKSYPDVCFAERYF